MLKHTASVHVVCHETQEVGDAGRVPISFPAAADHSCLYLYGIGGKPNGNCFSSGRSHLRLSCAGMLLERLDGHPVTKILKQPYFHDCQFVYDLLQGVFTTLDVAQAAVGFHHADFRLANVSTVTLYCNLVVTAVITCLLIV
jgi:hypothetical protein